MTTKITGEEYLNPQYNSRELNELMDKDYFESDDDNKNNQISVEEPPPLPPLENIEEESKIFLD